MSTATVTDGLGIDLEDITIRPSTINLNQPTTQAEGAIKGQFRLKDTGEHFTEFRFVLLTEQKRRDYHIGQKGTLNRTKENLICFSLDGIRPDATSKQVQNDLCATCKRSDWSPRETDKKFVPDCQLYYKVIFVDPVTMLPYTMWLRSTIKTAYEDGRSNLKKALTTMKVAGLNPRTFDLSFKLSPKKKSTNGLPSYVIDMTDFKVVTDEQSAQLAQMYKQYSAQGHSDSNELE